MKKISLFICSLLMLGLVSCEDELDQAPLSEASTVNFYNNPEEFEQAVNGVYAQLRPFPDRYYDLSETRSDNIYGSSSTGVRPWDPVNDFANTLANNELIEAAWSQNFNGIMRANTVLDRLNADIVPDEAQRNRVEGQARFLRALYYFDLVRWFGKVPIIRNVVTRSAALDIPRSSVPEVYEFIMSDLNSAIELLPPAWTGANVGRATSWAAKALLARVHLTRSGPDYGIEGPTLGVNEYCEALTLLNDIINNGPYGWVNDYARIFAYDNENNPDIIFDIQFQSGGLGLGTTLPGYMGTPAYFNAVKTVPLPQSSVEMREISDDLLNSYEPDDSRKAVTIQHGFTDEFGNVETRAFYRKFLNESNAGQNRFDWPINFPLIRYTDVLLMKAEAILRGAGCGGTQQDVDDIVNMVRARAGLEPISNVTLEMLLEERRHEFAGEGLRWHELVRFGVVLEKMNAWLPQEDELNRMPESIDPYHIIYPIPFTQLIIQEGLYEQNPGY